MNIWIHVLTIGFLLLLVEGKKADDPNILSNLDEKVQNYIKKVSDKNGHIKDNKTVESVGQLKKQLSKPSSLKDAKNRSTTMVDTTKKALNSIKRGLSNFFESLKPLKEKGSNIALDVHNAIRVATDRILEKLPKT